MTVGNFDKPQIILTLLPISSHLPSLSDMKSLPSLTLALLGLTVPNYLPAQSTAGAEKAKIQLTGDDEKPDASLKLDATGKLPMANKDDALAPLDAAEVKEAPLPPALAKLTRDQQGRYVSVRDEATNFMRSVRLQESLEKIGEAERIVGEPIAELENLRGAIYTKMRDFPMARKHFSNSVNLDKESFHPHFNLAELDFVEKKFPAAITAFTALIGENEKLKKTASSQVKPDDRVAVERQFDATKRLMEFKLFISQTLQKNQEEAAKLSKDFNAYDNDSPAYYFAKAVQDFNAEKKEAAEEWIASAKKIYPAAITEVFVDSLVEMGWMTTLAQ